MSLMRWLLCSAWLISSLAWGRPFPFTILHTNDLHSHFEGTGPDVKEGYAELPSRPGLGVSLNEKVAAAHPYKPTNRPEYRFGDGSVTDQ